MYVLIHRVVPQSGDNKDIVTCGMTVFVSGVVGYNDTEIAIGSMLMIKVDLRTVMIIINLLIMVMLIINHGDANGDNDDDVGNDLRSIEI